MRLEIKKLIFAFFAIPAVGISAESTVLLYAQSVIHYYVDLEKQIVRRCTSQNSAGNSVTQCTEIPIKVWQEWQE